MTTSKFNTVLSEITEISQNTPNHIDSNDLHNSKSILINAEEKTNILPGDIFVFKAVKTNISKCIAKLTDSDVTHIAMVCTVPTNYDNGTFVEMSITGIKLTQFRVNMNKDNIAIEGEEAYHLRLKATSCPSTILEVERLQAAAKKYVDEKDGFNFSLLILLASLLVCKELQYTSESATIALNILDFTHEVLELLTNELDKLWKMQDDKDYIDKSQTCSQLIYQIFWDSGYMLNTKPILSWNVDSQSKRNSNAGFIRLCDLDSEIKLNDHSSLKESKDIDLEEFAEKLLKALEETHEKPPSNSDDLEKLATVTKKFIAKREQIFRILHKNAPMDALFVTPADILYRTENLEHYQVMKILRF